MPLFTFFFAFLLTFFASSACAQSLAVAIPDTDAARLRIVGSDLLRENLGVELARFSKANDLPIEIALEGSRLGLERLEKGQADLGLLIFGDGDRRPDENFQVQVIGYLTAVVVAPTSFSITQLHFAQVAGVFGAVEPVNYSRWGELGETGPRSARGITALLAQWGGLSADLLRYRIMTNPELKPTVLRMSSPTELYARLAAEEGGLAVVPVPPTDDPRFKTLLLARNARDVAYGPTPENLHSGDYPVRIPLHLVLRRGESQRILPVARHILADETVSILRRDNVIRIPHQVRNQVLFELETR